MLHVRVSRVDDYAGELTQGLRKLEAEKARGYLSREEQEDFLLDLHKAIDRNDLRPMRTRALVDLVLAALTAAAAALLSWKLPEDHIPHAVLLALCAISLGMAAWRYRLYHRRRLHDRKWLTRLEQSVAAGGSIFD
ncbi:hypothetical protein METEAL_28660 [Mesoterricola silvestris]|uniref:Uncharacterized protein n=2 Tax=Mesoterricola silvestris TaxID=2927979 RepID=A0AA48GLN8_9BACT|nr:hypothetical protein METEAL_28660 [Mesoterricola silvestris]